MSRQDDETRSMARSVSSLSNIADSVAVVRFNPVDDMFENCYYIYEKLFFFLF